MKEWMNEWNFIYFLSFVGPQICGTLEKSENTAILWKACQQKCKRVRT